MNDFVFIPLFAGLVLALASNHAVVSQLLNNKVFQFFGNISYSIYLTHAVVIFMIIPLLFITGIGYHGPVEMPFFKGVGVCILFLTLITGISALTYYKIEKPCRNWINRKWAKRQKEVLSPAVVVP